MHSVGQVIAEASAFVAGLVVAFMFGTLPGWVGDLTGVAGLIVAIGAAVAVLWRAGKALTRAIVGQVGDVVRAETAPLHTRLERVEQIVAKQLEPNGGKSLVDRACRIDEALGGPTTEGA